MVVLVWAISGPIFGFSDTWQLVINTGTTIVTFLMVFLIQNTQNRDAMAMHLKLDELLRGVEGARTGMVDLESCTDEELDKIQAEFHRIRKLRAISPALAEREAKKIAAEEGGEASPVAAAADAAAAEGAEEVLIVTDAADWPQQLYRSLGFDEVGSTYEFLKVPIRSGP
jgi:low affinity Fe/Cu permease